MAEKKPLVIVGDSLFAEIAHEYFNYDSDFEVVAFAVEEQFRNRSMFRGLPVLPFESLDEELDPSQHSVYAAITYGKVNRLRARLAAEAKAKGFALASYVSSRAFVWRNVQIGEHAFIFEDNTVQPFVTIGRNCVMWSGNHIGHHSTIGDDVFIASHAVISGSVTVQNNTFIGVNATLVNDIEIASDTWVGPAVTLTRSTEPDSVWRPPRSERRGDTSTRELFKVSE